MQLLLNECDDEICDLPNVNISRCNPLRWSRLVGIKNFYGFYSHQGVGSFWAKANRISLRVIDRNSGFFFLLPRNFHPTE